jgi:hypothetical protein
MISETSLYNLDPHHYKIKRRIFIKNIGSISSSCLSDNFFILHIPTEYDYVFISNRKTEIIVKLMGLYERLTGKPLPINIDNRIEYKGDKASSSPSFVINFNKSEGNYLHSSPSLILSFLLLSSISLFLLFTTILCFLKVVSALLW